MINTRTHKEYMLAGLMRGLFVLRFSMVHFTVLDIRIFGFLACDCFVSRYICYSLACHFYFQTWHLYWLANFPTKYTPKISNKMKPPQKTNTTVFHIPDFCKRFLLQVQRETIDRMGKYCLPTCQQWGIITFWECHSSGTSGNLIKLRQRHVIGMLVGSASWCNVAIQNYIARLSIIVYFSMWQINT